MSLVLLVQTKRFCLAAVNTHTHTQYLFNDVEAKLQSLALQHRDEVFEEDGEMFMAVSEGDQDGHLQRKHDSLNTLGLQLTTILLAE